MEKLKRDIPLTLCKLEKIFPPAFFDVMVHLAIQYGSMYPIEQWLGTLKNLLTNRARPEGSIAKAYLESEMLAFLERFMDDVKTRYNLDDNMSHDGPAPGETSVFMHGVKPIGQIRVKDIKDKAKINKLAWYVQ